MPKQQELTYVEAARQVINELDGPITVNEFVQRVLAIKPSRAKSPRQAVLTALWRYQGTLFARPDSKTLVPLHVAMRGVRFRWRLSQVEVEHGQLLIESTFLGYGGNQYKIAEWLCLEDEKGLSLPVKEAELTLRTREIIQEEYLAEMEDYLEAYPEMSLKTLDLAEWMEAQNVKAGGSILFTIVAWEETKRVFRLEYEPPEELEAHRETIMAQDELLEATLFDILEHEREEAIWVRHAIPRLHVVLDGPRDIPGSHWTAAVTAKGRMRFDEIFITYIDSRQGFWVDFEVPSVIQPEKATEERKSKVFRFTVTFWNRKSPKRQVEVLGGQTLHDLDRVIRQAFKHDTSDHLGGFWKLIRRGNTNRYREVAIGTVYPFWPSEEAVNDVLVAELDLEVGDQMKYVYDFGDWIQHAVVLEAIDAPDARASYPRVLRKKRKATRKK